MKHFVLLTLTVLTLTTGKLFAANPAVTATSTAAITLPINVAVIGGSISGLNGSSYTNVTFTWTVSPAIAGMSSTTGNLLLVGGNATVPGPIVTFSPTINTTYTFTLTINYKKNGTAQSPLTSSTNVVVNVPLVASAGTDRTLTLSGTATTIGISIAGSASGGSGSYSYAWQKQSGPAGGSTSATTATVNLTGLQVGTYVYQFTVNGLAIDVVTVVVHPAPPELFFSNPTLASGTAGQNNAVYRFPNITSTPTSQVDALITIVGRSSADVALAKDASNNYVIDETGTGYDNAFQPRVNFTGAYTPSTDWYMEFKVAFVKAGTTTPVTVNSFGLSALDMDGNTTFHEYVTMYGLSSYTIEQSSVVTATPVTSPNGVRFDGAQTEFSGIDVTQTFDEASTNYTNTNSFNFRVGGKVTSGSGSNLGIDAGRQYSLWFKSLSFSTPVQTPLAINLMSFTATKQGSNGILNWSTANELNNEYMEVERSSDGVHFTTIGRVDGNGTTDMEHSYSYSDPIGGLTGIVYYRLRDVDADGNGSLSKIIALRLDGSSISASFSVYPNPFVSGVKVNVNSTREEKATVVIMNLAGQQLSAQPVSLQNGQNVIVMSNMSNLKPGMYIVEFTTDDAKFAQKIMKTL